MRVEDLDQLPEPELRLELANCCGSQKWVEAMVAKRPFEGREGLHKAAASSFEGLQEGDWLEAFAHHPQIGDIASLKKKFASTAYWASQEQGALQSASDAVLMEFKEKNETYLQQYGFIFIVCATGKAPEEMLAMLNNRLSQDRSAEIKIAAAEQIKITEIRLEKLIS